MDRLAFAMTNKGLRLELFLWEQANADVRKYLTPLNYALDKIDKPLGIRLRRRYQDQFYDFLANLISFWRIMRKE
jgi:hypothetical protein